jgi:hypothetical protein
MEERRLGLGEDVLRPAGEATVPAGVSVGIARIDGDGKKRESALSRLRQRQGHFGSSRLDAFDAGGFLCGCGSVAASRGDLGYFVGEQTGKAK